MVDFNNEGTVGTPPGDLLKIIALQKRDYFLDALEQYKKVEYKGQTEAEQNIVCARMLNLFLELQAALYRTMKGQRVKAMKDGKAVDVDRYDHLERLAYSKTVDDVLSAYYIINGWLDEKKLTRLDTRQDYDASRVERENRVKDL